MLRTLVTERLTLDAPADADIEAVFELCQDPEIHRWVPLPWPYGRDNAEFFVRSYAPHGLASGAYETWAIRTAADTPLIGAIELRRDEAAGSASFGCWLGEASRGHGFMKEAARAVIDYALGAGGPGYTRLRWEGLVGNDASRRIAVALGFVIDADPTRTVDFRGEPRPSWLGVLDARPRDDRG
ncbi:GNAT family N-acetyltransferase [Diaminobutyricibacter tongyongensis]|uniref:GNAT family N-acetyltransferase n=1 Tax=Leifsonia tongyongensis TaxID=1268043 RepID=A0A6L9XXP6_9MICO|nr:GNAT family N-acetyltransferase [Diaminobutyricibacter tongyongensis]NEN06210.1 GNAT family N-acetyltransferase [Diaminobutyricibacter tongyongensis]